MPNDATVIADPSSAAIPPAEVSPTPPDPAKFTPEARHDWLLKGQELVLPKEAESAPAPKQESKPAESTPAAADETPATEPSAPTGETVVAPEAAPKQGKKGKAEDRVAELLAERHELRTRIEALEKGAKKPAEPPAAETPKPSESKPVRPKLGDIPDESWEDYEARVDKYHADTQASLMAEIRSTVEREFTTKQQETAKRQWLEEGSKKHGADFPELVRTLETLFPEPLQVAVSALQDSAAMAAHLGKHPDEAEALAAKFKANPYGAIAELGRIEANLAAAVAAPPPPVEPKHTKAPSPPIDIAARNAGPVDEVKAAIEAGDFRKYYELANSRELRKKA